MAEKSDKKPDDKAAAAPKDATQAPEAKKGGGVLLKNTPVLMAIVMLVEAIVLFAGFKMLGGSPKSAQGAEFASGETKDEHSDSHGDAHADAHGGGGHGDAHGGGAAPTDKKKTAEIPVVDFKAPNRQNGRLYLYDVSVAVLTKGDLKAKVEGALKDREQTVKDRIRTIISQSDPEKLGGGSEPGLETLRRQIKHQLDELIGEGLIDEVLIIKCIPFRQEF